METAEFSFKLSVSESSCQSAIHSPRPQSMKKVSTTHQQQSQVVEEEETYTTRKSTRSMTVNQETHMASKTAKVAECSNQATLTHIKVEPSTPALSKLSTSSDDSKILMEDVQQKEEIPSNTCVLNSPQGETFTIAMLKIKLSHQGNDIMNKYNYTKYLDKEERKEALATLLAEEKRYKEWVKKAKQGKYSKEEVKEHKSKKASRREQIDSLDWLLFPKNQKDLAISTALTEGVPMTIRSVIDTYRKRFKKTPIPVPIKCDIEALESQLRSLEGKEAEWSKWFSNEVLSTEKNDKERVHKNIIETSLTQQLKRRDQILKLNFDIKKKKEMQNSKVSILKQSKPKS